jgi:hypothetical protein
MHGRVRNTKTLKENASTARKRSVAKGRREDRIKMDV